MQELQHHARSLCKQLQDALITNSTASHMATHVFSTTEALTDCLEEQHECGLQVVRQVCLQARLLHHTSCLTHSEVEHLVHKNGHCDSHIGVSIFLIAVALKHVQEHNSVVMCMHLQAADTQVPHMLPRI